MEKVWLETWNTAGIELMDQEGGVWGDRACGQSPQPEHQAPE